MSISKSIYYDNLAYTRCLGREVSKRDVEMARPLAIAHGVSVRQRKHVNKRFTDSVEKEDKMLAMRAHLHLNISVIYTEKEDFEDLVVPELLARTGRSCG